MLSRLMTRREQFVIAFLAVSIAAGAVVLYVTQRDASAPAAYIVEDAEPSNGDGKAENPPSPKSAGEDPESSGRATPPPASIAEVVVSIQGAVQRPGVYTLSSGSRVNDLIDAAGGLQPDAQTRDINLAARLIDGTTLTVPETAAPVRRNEAGVSADVTPNPGAYTVTGQSPTPGSGPVSRSATHAGGALINVNLATQSELETLPGIGPVLAQRIIQHRNSQPFRTIQQLTEVRGIGPKTLEDIRPMITVN